MAQLLQVPEPSGFRLGGGSMVPRSDTALRCRWLPLGTRLPPHWGLWNHSGRSGTGMGCHTRHEVTGQYEAPGGWHGLARGTSCALDRNLDGLPKSPKTAPMTLIAQATAADRPELRPRDPKCRPLPASQVNGSVTRRDSKPRRMTPAVRDFS